MEVAFKVKKDSELYQHYFAAKAEEKKFIDRAMSFFDAHNIPGEEFLISDRLTIYMSVEDRKNIFHRYAKNSVMDAIQNLKSIQNLINFGNKRFAHKLIWTRFMIKSSIRGM